MFDAIKKWFASRNKLPEAKMAEFESEGLLAVGEYVKAKLTYLNYKAPGKRFGYKKVWFRAHVALTKVRFFAIVYGKLSIDIPFADERSRAMRFTVENGQFLLVSFDAGLFHPEWSGTLEYRFAVPEPQQFVDLIQKQVSV
jgi:hypothetical protein